MNENFFLSLSFWKFESTQHMGIFWYPTCQVGGWYSCTSTYKFTAYTFRELMKSHEPFCFPVKNLLVVHQCKFVRLQQFETERVRACIISIFLFIVFGKWFASSAFNIAEVFFLYSFPLHCICSISFVIGLVTHIVGFRSRDEKYTHPHSSHYERRFVKLPIDLTLSDGRCEHPTNTSALRNGNFLRKMLDDGCIYAWQNGEALSNFTLRGDIRIHFECITIYNINGIIVHDGRMWAQMWLSADEKMDQMRTWKRQHPHTCSFFFPLSLFSFVCGKRAPHWVLKIA